MTTKLKIIILLFFTSTNFSIGQTSKKDLLLGEWTEVRREQRSGYIYTIGGILNEPSIELSFLKDGTGLFYNPQTPDPKSYPQYLILGDTLLAWKDQGRVRIVDIVEITEGTLVIIFRINNKSKDDELDLKCHFIRKENYLKLTKEEINKLKAPSERDKKYLAEIIARRNRRKK